MGGAGACYHARRKPNGRIPALAVGDLVLCESAAICMHIADHHPDAKLAPPLRTPERSHFYKWLVFLTNTVQAEVMTYHYPENHTDDPAQEAAVKRIAAERTMKAWAVLEQNLGAVGMNPGAITSGA